MVQALSEFEIFCKGRLRSLHGSSNSCTLNEMELRERQRTILASVRESVLDITPTADGYAYRFKSESEILMRLSTLVDLERRCCPFLTFRIVVEPQQPIRLEITGPPDAKAVIGLFGA